MVRNLNEIISNVNQIIKSLLNNSGREEIIIVVWTASKEVSKLSNTVNLKNSVRLVVLFNACRQREKKAMSFSSVCNLNFGKQQISLYQLLYMKSYLTNLFSISFYFTSLLYSYILIFLIPKVDPQFNLFIRDPFSFLGQSPIWTQQ